MESKNKVKLQETEEIGDCQRLGGRRDEGMLVKGYTFPVLSSGDLMSSMVTEVNNIGLYT